MIRVIKESYRSIKNKIISNNIYFPITICNVPNKKINTIIKKCVLKI